MPGSASLADELVAQVRRTDPPGLPRPLPRDRADRAGLAHPAVHRPDLGPARGLVPPGRPRAGRHPGRGRRGLRPAGRAAPPAVRRTADPHRRGRPPDPPHRRAGRTPTGRLRTTSPRRERRRTARRRQRDPRRRPQPVRRPHRRGTAGRGRPQGRTRAAVRRGPRTARRPPLPHPTGPATARTGRPGQPRVRARRTGQPTPSTLARLAASRTDRHRHLQRDRRRSSRDRRIRRLMAGPDRPERGRLASCRTGRRRVLQRTRAVPLRPQRQPTLPAHRRRGRRDRCHRTARRLGTGPEDQPSRRRGPASATSDRRPAPAAAGRRRSTGRLATAHENGSVPPARATSVSNSPGSQYRPL